MGQPDRVAFQLPADASAVTEARHRAVEAARCRVPEEHRLTLALLVSEVVTNAVLHGGAKRPLDVSLTLDGGTVRVEVENVGAGFVPAPRALEPDDVGGWGLYLVERLTRAWGVSSGDRTVVWFELEYATGV